jgi:hypothetical protein
MNGSAQFHALVALSLRKELPVPIEWALTPVLTLWMTEEFFPVTNSNTDALLKGHIYTDVATPTASILY